VDWAIGKFTTISQIVEPFGSPVYLDVKQHDKKQSSTARKNPRLESAQSQKDKPWDTRFPGGFEPQT
jgi:hypothetical protein